MVFIKDISGFPRDYKRIEHEEKLKRIQTASTKEGDSTKKSESFLTGQDKVEISPEGKTLVATKTEVNKYVDALRHLRLLNNEKIEDIHSKIKSNYYSRPETLEKIIGSLISADEFKSISAEEVDTKKGLTVERLQHIRQKINNNDYSDPSVLDRVVSELMKII